MIGMYEQIDILEQKRRELALAIFAMPVQVNPIPGGVREQMLEEYVKTARRIQSLRTHLV